MRRSEKKKRSPAALIALGLALTAGLLAVSLARETLRGRQIDREIDTLRAEAERLRVKNFEISSLSGSLDDEEFLEREARLKLNLRKEGERVVVLTEPEAAWIRPAAAGAEAPDAGEEWPNPKKWWAYFFDRGAYEDRLSLLHGDS